MNTSGGGTYKWEEFIEKSSSAGRTYRDVFIGANKNREGFIEKKLIGKSLSTGGTLPWRLRKIQIAYEMTNILVLVKLLSY